MPRPRFAVAHGEWFGPGMDADEIAVLTTLALMANPDGDCYPRQSKIAAMLGRSRKWVNGVIGVLKAKKLIEIIENKGRGLTYRLIGHAALVKERREERRATDGDSRCNRKRTADVTSGNTEQNQEPKPLNSRPAAEPEPVARPAPPPETWNDQPRWKVERQADQEADAAVEAAIEQGETPPLIQEAPAEVQAQWAGFASVPATGRRTLMLIACIAEQRRRGLRPPKE